MIFSLVLACVISSSDHTGTAASTDTKNILQQPPKPPTINRAPTNLAPPPHQAHVTKPKDLVAVEPSWIEVPVVRKQKKSIIMISLDTVQAKRLSLYGGRAQVPNITEFANKSVVFQQAISHFPQTPHSHWSVMTGVLPEVHGDVPTNRGSIYSGPTIAEIAKRYGYTTGAFISGYSLTKAVTGLHRGFDTYDEDYPFDKVDNRPGTDITKRALGWLEEVQKTDTPFFLFVHYFDAHHPYVPKNNIYDPGYTGKVDGTDDTILEYREGRAVPSKRDVEHVLALYDAEITELDRTIADLLNNIPKDTVVVLFGDHGESFSHNYYFSHQDGLWDELLHVPLVVYSPDIQKAKEIPNLVGLYDIAPTVLDLAGLPKDKRMQGKSLLGLIDPKLWTSPTPLPTIEEDRRIYSITNQWNTQRRFAVRTKEWKIIHSPRGMERYNILQDPMELNNLSNTTVDLRAERNRYNDMIISLRPYQSQSINNQPLDHRECRQLEKLGYTTCATSDMK